MIKKTFIVLASVLVSVSMWAQSPPPGTISRVPGDTNQFGTGSAFTNRAGAAYSADQLAAQLQTLRTAVEQTLPSLTAYTETVSNTATSGNRSVTGTISEILAGALKRNAPTQSSTAQPAQGGVAGALQGLLGTNATASANTTNLRDLAALQNELQMVESILQRLNVGSNTNWGGLTPTGR